MEANDSNYVAELLQELEELKRKRARKLQQLKKLKKRSSYKEENLVEDISCHRTKDVSQHTTASRETPGSSETKCAKCRLCLMNKDGPCKQCLTTDCKENQYQKDIITTLKAESTNSENMLNQCPNKSNHVEENLSKQNVTYEILKVTHNISVAELSPKSRTHVNFNEVLLNDCSQVSGKQRKRPTSSEEEPKQDDHKKLKLSREMSPKTNGIAHAVVDVAEDSLLHDMSCFLSPDLLGGDEGDACFAKKKILAGSETNQANNGLDLKSISNDEDVFLSSSSVKGDNPKKSEAKDSAKTSYDSTSIKPVPELDVFVENDDCVDNTSLSCNGGIARALDTFSSADTLQHSENVQTKDSEQMPHCITIQDDTKVEVLSPKLEKNTNFSEIHKTTLNCLPGVNEVKSEMYATEACEDTYEDLTNNLQLIEGLKASDFSSFENSSSVEILSSVANMDTKETADNHTSNMLISSNRINMLDSITTDKPSSENNNVRVKQENVNDNKTEDMIHSVHIESKNVEPESTLNCLPKTSALRGDLSLLEMEEIENLFAGDALTPDIDFECILLEVADTMDDQLTKSCKNGSVMSLEKPVKSPTKCTSTNVIDEVFTIPETEQLFGGPCFDKIETSSDEDMEHQDKATRDSPVMEDFSKVSTNCDVSEETQCNTLDQLQTIPDSLCLGAKDSSELGNFKNIPLTENKVKKTSSSNLEDMHDPQQTILKYVCCLQSNIDEPVNDIKLAFFNNSNYVFIQHVTWIQVWRQEENKDWSKIFAHQVDNELKIQEICFTKDACHLVLAMLLSSDQVHCLQFLLFESETRVIKLMEHTHCLQKRSANETMLLCGLEDLKFSTAQGKETFDVFLHVFSSLRDNPRLMMAALGSTTGRLQSLCNIEKLPNALMGTSNNMLYLWHLLEARLVTSVCLQLPDLLSAIERCVWATFENNLVFLMAVCEGKEEGSRSCHLLATNLANGSCEIAMTYSFLPSTESPRTSNLKTVYCEPFLAASCEDGSFLWSVMDEYCFAALDIKDSVTSISIGRYRGNTFLVAVGNEDGCVNCCSIKSLDQN